MQATFTVNRLRYHDEPIVNGSYVNSASVEVRISSVSILEDRFVHVCIRQEPGKCTDFRLPIGTARAIASAMMGAASDKSPEVYS